MAEVHFFGRIIGASDYQSHSLFCKWEICSGNGWSLLEGLDKGQTQVDIPHNKDLVIWGHPLDLHFATKGVQGWPKFACQVWHQDLYGRAELWAYGFVHLPTSPGHHSLTCMTWRPVGTAMQEFSRCFLGGGPELRSTEMVFTPHNRYRLQTVAMGKVNLEVAVVLRNFQKFGVET